MGNSTFSPSHRCLVDIQSRVRNHSARPQVAVRDRRAESNNSTSNSELGEHSSHRLKPFRVCDGFLLSRAEAGDDQALLCRPVIERKVQKSGTRAGRSLDVAKMERILQPPQALAY